MLHVAWTTVSSRADAEKMASEVIAARLAACVQIEGPITSFYLWQGAIERSEEYRLMFKCLPEQSDLIKAAILKIHPYDTPEWITVKTQDVSEKYLSWAKATHTK